MINGTEFILPYQNCVNCVNIEKKNQDIDWGIGINFGLSVNLFGYKKSKNIIIKYYYIFISLTTKMYFQIRNDNLRINFYTKGKIKK